MNRKQEEKVRTDGEIVDAIIKGSGNSFHCSVANLFRDLGWRTRMSQFYVDATTEKAREIDLIVENVQQFADPYEGGAVNIHLRLYMECKFNPATRGTMFWFDAKDLDSTRQWLERYTPLRRTNTCVDWHHYVKNGGEVAKLFATENVRPDDPDPVFKALNQCLSGYVKMRHISIATKVPRSGGTAHLYYPVLVFSSFDKFFRTDVKGDGSFKRQTDNFQLEVNYAYPSDQGSRSEYLIVDVVEFSQLNAFLQTLEADVKAAKVMTLKS